MYTGTKVLAGIAQLVEQWIENPRVSSSNLDPGIRFQILERLFIKIYRIASSANYIYLSTYLTFIARIQI